ncbi:MAG: DUF4031 domain-containing protein [Nostocoides sp.]
MTVWIDQPLWHAHGRVWSHLISDQSLAELHAFARAAGLPGGGFEGDHYDVPAERHTAMISAGAQAVDGRELVRILRRSGLRVQKRRGERVLSSRRVPAGAPGMREDVILSGQDEPPAGTVRILLAVFRGDRLWTAPTTTGAWSLPTGTVGLLAYPAAVDDLRRRAPRTSTAPTMVGYVREMSLPATPQQQAARLRVCTVVLRGSAEDLDGQVSHPGRWVSRVGADERFVSQPWLPILNHAWP